MQKYEFKTVPFSEALIRNHRLHIVDSDNLGGSTVLLLLDGDIKTRRPNTFVVCYANGAPVGMAVVFRVLGVHDPFAFYEEDDPKRYELLGQMHVYVKMEHRCRGIGAQLLSLAMKDFIKKYPMIKTVRAGRDVKNKFPHSPGVTPIFSDFSLRSNAPKSFLRRLEVHAMEHVSVLNEAKGGRREQQEGSNRKF